MTGKAGGRVVGSPWNVNTAQLAGIATELRSELMKPFRSYKSVTLLSRLASTGSYCRGNCGVYKQLLTGEFGLLIVIWDR